MTIVTTVARPVARIDGLKWSAYRRQACICDFAVYYLMQARGERHGVRLLRLPRPRPQARLPGRRQRKPRPARLRRGRVLWRATGSGEVVRRAVGAWGRRRERGDDVADRPLRCGCRPCPFRTYICYNGGSLAEKKFGFSGKERVSQMCSAIFTTSAVLIALSLAFLFAIALLVGSVPGSIQQMFAIPIIIGALGIGASIAAVSEE